MGVIHKSLRMNIGAGPVLTLMVSLILYSTLFGQDSLAYTGFCEYSAAPSDGCCSETEDCESGSCLHKRGMCSNLFSYLPCDVDSDCGFFYPESHMWCMSMGECVGGEEDGEWCIPIFTLGVYGGCGGGILQPCRTSKDCYDGDDCIYMTGYCPGGNCCPGGTCVGCVEACSIATVTYGTELESNTDVLRAFRDKYLLNNSLGRAFVEAYYKYSPPIAHYIAQREWLKSVVRILLQPVIGLISLFV